MILNSITSFALSNCFQSTGKGMAGRTPQMVNIILLLIYMTC